MDSKLLIYDSPNLLADLKLLRKNLTVNCEHKPVQSTNL